MSVFYAVLSGVRTQHHPLSAANAKNRVGNAHGGVPNDVFRRAHIVIQPFVTKMCHILTVTQPANKP